MPQLVTKVRIKPGLSESFVDWQALLNSKIASFPGFLSLEISKPLGDSWMIVQRFQNVEEVEAWKNSSARKHLFESLQNFLSEPLQEIDPNLHDEWGVTEVFVTEVSKDHEEAFREWIAKIHQVEAKFEGFKGMYIQSPKTGKDSHWITLLQFDTAEHLDNWLLSKERSVVLKEAENFIKNLESHRVISPYAGWFSSISKGEAVPAVWKQTMIVLLVLFPVVMLELKFLSPWTQELNHSLSTFIGNAISVSLVSWPLMPIAIYFLGWWLAPIGDHQLRKNILGAIIVLVLYLIEIFSLWNLL